MRKNYFILLIILLVSCNIKNDKTGQEEHHEHHNEKGTVVLNQEQQKALGLKLGNFQMRNLTTVIKTNGELVVAPTHKAEITAFSGGNVKKIRVFHGDKVKKGQILAVLEHPDYIKLQEDFAEIANKMEYLKLEYERQKKLYENNVGAGKDLQKIKSDFNIAKAKYKGLKSRLKLLNINPENIEKGNISSTINILSPINGYVNEINIRLGSYADEKEKLFEITDNSQIHADFTVFEKDVHKIKKGQKIHFTIANRPDEEYTATIFAIGKEFEKNTRAVHIHAKPDKQVNDLIPGMYITGHIHTDKRFTPTLPDDAIVKEGTKSYIFVLKDNNNNEHEHDENNSLHKTEYDMEDSHDHDEKESHNEENVSVFEMVEVITGQKDEGYTEIKLINPLPDDTKIVLNAAYYLLADMKKEETEHKH